MKLSLTFDKRLEFFLPIEKRGKTVFYRLGRKASVKDIIESLGVPHTETGALSFNQQLVGFSFIPEEGGCLEIHAVDTPFDVTLPSFLRPEAFSDVRFIADVNVIRLGRLLILMGFDVVYSPDLSDDVIADMAECEKRIVLTRDTDLLKRKKIVFARRLRANYPYDQLKEVVTFFGLEHQISFFSRCTRCNVLLQPVDKMTIFHLLEPKTKKYFNTFYQCPRCLGVFWKGSHYENIVEKLSGMGIPVRDEKKEANKRTPLG